MIKGLACSGSTANQMDSACLLHSVMEGKVTSNQMETCFTKTTRRLISSVYVYTQTADRTWQNHLDDCDADYRWDVKAHPHNVTNGYSLVNVENCYVNTFK